MWRLGADSHAVLYALMCLMPEQHAKDSLMCRYVPGQQLQLCRDALMLCIVTIKQQHLACVGNGGPQDCQAQTCVL